MSTSLSTDSSNSFTWDDYLIKTNGRAAKLECFKQSRLPPPNNFEVNTLLEAEDQRSAALDLQSPSFYSHETSKSKQSHYSGLGDTPGSSTRRSTMASCPTGSVRRFRAAAFSLARVVETWGPRLRIRLIGTDDRNDYWFLVDSEQIRPYPSGNALQPPFGYMHNHLVWNRTLKKATDGAKFAESSWFIKPPPDPEDNLFQVNDKLEAVDRRNTQLICPASIGAVNGQHVLVSFDGWSGAFDYWARFDSRELFPVGWCKLANYPLQPPGPNVNRSPTSHSTPALSITRNLSLNSPSHQGAPSLKLSVDLGKSSTKQTPFPSSKSVKPRETARPKVNRSTFQSRKRAKSMSHSNKLGRLVKSRKLGSVSLPMKKPTSYSPNHNASSWSDYHRKRDSGSALNLDDSSALPLHTQNESASSSLRSLSSPPIIHPILEDVNDGPNNLSSSPPSDHPPRIEAVLPLTDPVVPRHRRTSSSSDCVVRLQAKSSVSPISTSYPLQPEFKSWQVVSEPKLKSKKPKSAGRYHVKSSDSLKKRLKLVNGNLLDHANSTFDHKPKTGSDLGSLDHDHSKIVKASTTTTTTMTTNKPTAPDALNPITIKTTTSPSSLSNCTSIPSSKSQDYMATNTTTSTMGGPTSGYRSANYFFEDMGLSSNENLSVETSIASSVWFSGLGAKIDSVPSNPMCVHQNMADYLDSQSQTTHLPSSTVSPSSLDLGPCPLPNPTLWTIDEVYHYITSRDSSLAEAADKFKHHEIDGQALLLLNMESLRNYMKIKLGPALKIDHMINRLKRGLL